MNIKIYKILAISLVLVLVSIFLPLSKVNADPDPLSAEDQAQQFVNNANQGLDPSDPHYYTIADDGKTVVCANGTTGTFEDKQPPTDTQCQGDECGDQTPPPPGNSCSSCGCTTCIYGGTKGWKCGGVQCESTPTSSPTPPKSSPTPTPRNSSTPTPRKTGTPTPTKPQTSNTPTSTKTPTPSSTPSPTKTPTPTSSPTPTFTPTPTPFNPAACTCDGIQYTTIGSGQPLTVTSFGKVTGADTSKAQIVDQKFFLAEGAETLATIIARSDAIPATVVSNTSDLVRYQSVWNLTLPQLKSGATYRIWSQINCQPKTTAMVTTQNTKKAVLAAETKKSFWDILMTPFTWLFGGKSNNFTSNQATVTPVSVSGNSTDADQPVRPAANDSLQLQTIQPVEVYQKTCSFIKFRYNFNAK